MLDDRVRVVAISWIPTQGGSGEPGGRGRRGRRAPRACPICSTRARPSGQLPVDVDALGCDFLSATGRKYLRGAAGHRVPLRAARRGSTGWSHRSSTCTPRSGRTATGWSMRDDARRFESWEHSVANRLGLGAAVDDALALGVDAIAARVRGPRDVAARAARAPCPGLVLHDPASNGAGSSPSPSTASTCTSSRPGCAPRRINISVSTIDFARYDFEARGLDAVARASVHYYNTEDELTRLVDASHCTARVVPEPPAATPLEPLGEDPQAVGDVEQVRLRRPRRTGRHLVAGAARRRAVKRSGNASTRTITDSGSGDHSKPHSRHGLPYSVIHHSFSAMPSVHGAPRGDDDGARPHRRPRAATRSRRRRPPVGCRAAAAPRAPRGWRRRCRARAPSPRPSACRWRSPTGG